MINSTMENVDEALEMNCNIIGMLKIGINVRLQFPFSRIKDLDCCSAIEQGGESNLVAEAWERNM